MKKRKKKRKNKLPVSPSKVSEGTLGIYLKEIQKFPLLSAEEEKELARRIREENDKEALDKLIKSNLRFVVNIAKAYQDMGLPLADLITEGNMGLIRAAKKYDERKGVKFISYAVWWIKQAIQKAILEQSRIVRLPASVINRVMKAQKAGRELFYVMGREPTAEEIATHLNVSPEEIKQATELAQRDISLDAEIKNAENLYLADVIEEKTYPSPEEVFLRKNLLYELRHNLANLPDRERTVLEKYFGLDGQRPHTLEEIGKELGVSRERVRQIKERAIKLLRKMVSEKSKLPVPYETFH